MPVVDIHSHLYPPEYIEIFEGTHLPGRPLTDHYYSVTAKIAFMDTHDIDISVLSMGNPWLDFLEPSMAGETAVSMNNAMNTLCEKYKQRLYFFAMLPLSRLDESTILVQVQNITMLPQARGVVIGTNGLGDGLDDPRLLPVWRALAEADLPVFIHPNYGLPASVWGGKHGNSQIMPLSIGFTAETTIAITRMFLARVFDKIPKLRLILSHSGGTLPFLAGRIEAFIFDKIGLKAAVEASGVDRVMFGTDHPFFAPVKKTALWPAMTWNRDAVREALGDEEYAMVMGGNAKRVLHL
ncbi:hypothetical protein UA08_04736 [Talaromyces atroroseus]|uniref:Amidohydrolase-related domain-containing protein n=1 Tax=Talaromyces atroroseus TaxID=1441469 RepID=A0A225AH48_TALAT|nr:hypothetical protein UA08_04736 [Talaromyces atroroseus]OKL60060.1 hypothetical protein UA08_04736 [Talaromyces atroroseus]